jgi:hypothetical protein
MEEIRGRLRRLIDAWEAGAVDEWAVREEAEIIGLAIPWDDLELEARIPVYTVADTLDTMMVSLVTKDDIPVLRALLEAEPSAYEAAWAAWSDYWNSIDYQARARDLLSSPFYGGVAASELAYPTRRPR